MVISEEKKRKEVEGSLNREHSAMRYPSAKEAKDDRDCENWQRIFVQNVGEYLHSGLPIRKAQEIPECPTWDDDVPH